MTKKSRTRPRVVAHSRGWKLEKGWLIILLMFLLVIAYEAYRQVV